MGCLRSVNNKRREEYLNRKGFVNQKNQVKEKREGAPLIFVSDFLFGISKNKHKKNTSQFHGN
jgi:hypothetical protein